MSYNSISYFNKIMLNKDKVFASIDNKKDNDDGIYLFCNKNKIEPVYDKLDGDDK